MLFSSSKNDQSFQKSERKKDIMSLEVRCSNRVRERHKYYFNAVVQLLLDLIVEVYLYPQGIFLKLSQGLRTMKRLSHHL